MLPEVTCVLLPVQQHIIIAILHGKVKHSLVWALKTLQVVKPGLLGVITVVALIQVTKREGPRGSPDWQMEGAAVHRQLPAVL